MKCGWCSSTDIDFDTVDNGVGLQQVTPGICLRCGAVEIGPHEQEWVNPLDKERGWYAGPSELQFVGPVVPPPIRTESMRAWLCDYGTRVLVPWVEMTHVAHVEKILGHAQFRTNCGLVFDACDAPLSDVVTCLTCICEETE